MSVAVELKRRYRSRFRTRTVDYLQNDRGERAGIKSVTVTWSERRPSLKAFAKSEGTLDAFRASKRAQRRKK